MRRATLFDDVLRDVVALVTTATPKSHFARALFLYLLLSRFVTYFRTPRPPALTPGVGYK